MQNKYDEVLQLLKKLESVFISIKEYRMTHGYLHLLLTNKSFKVLGQILLFECFFICGPTSSGGPYKVTIKKEFDGKQDIFTVFSEPEGFIAKCLRVDITDEEWRTKLI